MSLPGPSLRALHAPSIQQYAADDPRKLPSTEQNSNIYSRYSATALCVSQIAPIYVSFTAPILVSPNNGARLAGALRIGVHRKSERCDT